MRGWLHCFAFATTRKMRNRDISSRHMFGTGSPTPLLTKLTLLCYTGEVEDLLSQVLQVTGVRNSFLFLMTTSLALAPAPDIDEWGQQPSPVLTIIKQMSSGNSSPMITISELSHAHLHGRLYCAALVRYSACSAVHCSW